MTDLQECITEASLDGYDVTITIKPRRDGRRGDLILPLEWARSLPVRYDLMSEPDMARISGADQA